MTKELNVRATDIPGLLVIDLPVHGDNRGWFKENWQREKMRAAGLPDFDPVQNNITVLRTILRLMGKDENDFEHVIDRPGHDMRYAIDGTRLREELGCEPQFTDFEVGLADTIAWYTDNRSWWEPLKAEVEAKYAKAGQ